jgi:hypothetical protein
MYQYFQHFTDKYSKDKLGEHAKPGEAHLNICNEQVFNLVLFQKLRSIYS